eukprot:TRINITY_DN34106_c0_g1_i4.p1 TRINITY_DN34106_c0_g1~~TRINITY_DN34106_c0_g1_i4.p1  ORF type:complete len:396 (+),score=109.08 TRINITY_DN34106_c0_g1_i4:119-1306(+)
MRVSEEVVDIAAELEAVTQRVDKLFQVLLPPAACSEVWAASLHLLSGCVNFLQSWQRSLAAASPPPATLLQQSAFTRDVRSDLELSVSSVSLCSIDDIVAGSSTRPSLCRDGSDGHCGEEMAALELSQPGSKGGNTAAPGALQAMAARQLEELRNDCRQHVAELQRRLDSERSLLHQFVEAEVATLFSTWSSCDALLAPADEHTRLPGSAPRLVAAELERQASRLRLRQRQLVGAHRAEEMRRQATHAVMRAAEEHLEEVLENSRHSWWESTLAKPLARRLPEAPPPPQSPPTNSSEASTTSPRHIVVASSRLLLQRPDVQPPLTATAEPVELVGPSAPVTPAARALPQFTRTGLRPLQPTQQSSYEGAAEAVKVAAALATGQRALDSRRAAPST